MALVPIPYRGDLVISGASWLYYGYREFICWGQPCDGLASYLGDGEKNHSSVLEISAGLRCHWAGMTNCHQFFMRLSSTVITNEFRHNIFKVAVDVADINLFFCDNKLSNCLLSLVDT